MDTRADEKRNDDMTDPTAEGREPQTAPYPIDLIEPRHRDADTATFPGLPTFEGTVAPDRPLKVCIATIDVVGPVRNGGIGTAYRYVADFLVSCGHEVTILYGLGQHCENGAIEDWVDFYRERGITFVPMPQPELRSSRGPVGATSRISRLTYEWLKDRDFDVVHVSEWRGVGYYSLLAKNLGLAFKDTVFVVKCSSPTMWNKIGGNVLPDEKRDLILSYMERRSVELADIVVSGSLHMLRWMLDSGYNLVRPRCRVQPNIMLTSTLEEAVPESNEQGQRRPIDEIVFFGRLEPRKGIHIFCEAVDRLVKAGGPLPKKVTFLGKFAKVFDAETHIGERKERWPFEVETITGYDQPMAVHYLRQPGRVAVIPSLLENSSFAIYECLIYQINFLASDRGGNAELIHEDDYDDILFQAHPASLKRQFERVLTHGALVARPSFDNDENNRTWVNWHASLTKPGAIQALSRFPEAPAEPREPLVSVCLAHYERPDMVRHAIRSIEEQTYRNYEVVLVDDGSTSPTTVAFLEELKTDFAARGWQVVVQENAYLGASRNTAARHANGEYLLFMDDDNLAMPNEIETFVHVAERSDADIFTCFSDMFAGDGLPSKENSVSRITPIGPSLTVGAFVNCFGDSNSFVRKNSFDRIGGFTEDYRIGRDDQEFFSRAVINGFKLEVVPETLYWYRRPKPGAGMKAMNYSVSAGQYRVLRPYIAALPLALRNFILYAVGLENKASMLQAENRELQRRIEELEGSAPPAKKKKTPLYLIIYRRIRKLFN